MLLFLLLTGCSGEKPEALVASAKGLLAKNDTNAAIIQLRNALQKNPDLAETRFLLGKAELETGDLAGAQKELRRALELKYSPDDVIPPLAEAMLRSGEFKKVIDEFGKAEAKAPEAPAADLPAPSPRRCSRWGWPKRTDKSNKPAVTVTTPKPEQRLQTTLGKAQLALRMSRPPVPHSRRRSPPKLIIRRVVWPGPARRRQGRFAGRLAACRLSAGKVPKLVEGLGFKGEIQLAQGQQDDALARIARRWKPSPTICRHTRQSCRCSPTGQARRRVEAARRDAKGRTEESANALPAGATGFQSQKDFAAARESIQKLLAVAPGNLTGLLLAGAIDFRAQVRRKPKRTCSRC